ncbi:MAG: type III toxin-antitoxin system ToxN/AbiQ family toxin [Veillonella sp.]|uniref:type III toxin-antitoxin system ToxN/AbiQ family toxin n=1 Tax=Veillonella sp. TaxID=1926307 RepID=UPI0028FF9A46|nr:type III toxin-antitoxin system ToxN/AbiQ family toxin [Veillonella sp.]MDU2702388.1 type III toxin-antitoxin system ToxN/AbiQ family toxin [Veillonella sp.]
MRIYRIKDEYIEYLKKYDGKVANNKKEKRPYVGIVLEVNGFQYFAPLTSPKPKHEKMKNKLDFIKLSDGKLGAINLNNMIPVNSNVVINMDINKDCDIKYRELLKDQLEFINSNAKLIQGQANKLYIKVTEFNSFIKERCVNYKLLEEKALLFNVEKEVAITKTKNIKDIVSEAAKKAEKHNRKIENSIKIEKSFKDFG